MDAIDPTTPDLAATALHAHVADLEACLDLINSEELTDGIPEEHLPTAGDVIVYFVTRGLAHEDALRAQAAADGDALVTRVHRTRDALREVWDGAVEGRSVAADAIDEVNAVLAHAPRPRLRPGIAGVVVDHRHETADPIGEALARVAEPLVVALAAGDTDRFRICANDGCRWVFEDTSRGGRRRWCDMSSCGNRAKVRRFRSKQRESSPAGVEPGPERLSALEQWLDLRREPGH